MDSFIQIYYKKKDVYLKKGMFYLKKNIYLHI